MKKISMILICILLISKVASAQYKINKNKYNYRSYTYQGGDPYNPSVAGLTSFLIPGLGQMISGESGRGAAFLGGFAGGAIMIVAGVNLSNTYTESDPGNEGSIVIVAGLVTVGLISMIGVDIWAVTDAIRVAKVNNLAFRDKNKTGYNLEVIPYVGSLRTENLPIGLSLRVRF
jgi:hypothetical protein